jgi:hypothetical protein
MSGECGFSICVLSHLNEGEMLAFFMRGLLIVLPDLLPTIVFQCITTYGGGITQQNTNKFLKVEASWVVYSI